VLNPHIPGNRITGFLVFIKYPGGMPEWLKGTGCKPVGVRLRWFESNSLHHFSLWNG
jgi:hypothetical protein